MSRAQVSLMCKYLRRYKSLLAYGQSKLANVLHANELSRRLKVCDFIVVWKLCTSCLKLLNDIHQASDIVHLFIFNQSG